MIFLYDLLPAVVSANQIPGLKILVYMWYTQPIFTDIGHISYDIVTSNGDIFRITGPLCGEFIGPRWIPLTQASDAELWCFLWSAPQ